MANGFDIKLGGEKCDMIIDRSRQALRRSSATPFAFRGFLLHRSISAAKSPSYFFTRNANILGPQYRWTRLPLAGPTPHLTKTKLAKLGFRYRMEGVRRL